MLGVIKNRVWNVVWQYKFIMDRVELDGMMLLSMIKNVELYLGQKKELECWKNSRKWMKRNYSESVGSEGRKGKGSKMMYRNWWSGIYIFIFTIFFIYGKVREVGFSRLCDHATIRTHIKLMQNVDVKCSKTVVWAYKL